MNLAKLYRIHLIVSICIVIGACSSHNGVERSMAIQAQASEKGWVSQIIPTPQFDLQVFVNRLPIVNRQTNESRSDFLPLDLLTVYVEGDGYAWVHGQYASDDPTPYMAIGLQLAFAQPEGTVAYIARPCQYLGVQNNPACTKKIWTDARFSEPVVESINLALTHLKSQYKAKNIELIGYSGGAAITLLLAARRNDVVRIITISGNIDPQAWVKSLHLKDLDGSLKTVNVIPKIFRIPQLNFVGGKDNVMPQVIIENFAKRYPAGFQPRIIVIKDNGHVCCWAQEWATLWRSYIK